MARIAICLIISIGFCSQLNAQAEYYYYKPANNFGSDQYFNPINMLLNGSFDILRNGNHDRAISQLPYQAGWDNVYQNISHPRSSIKKYGWKNFLNRELFSFDFQFDGMQFFPNIFDHVLGNGVTYVKTAEWLDYHSYPMPYLLSMVGTTAYQAMNEIVENGGGSGVNVDPIADMLIFNPLGLILFSTRPVKVFFRDRIRVYDWSLQPMLNPRTGELQNVGQNYSAKFTPSKWKQLSLFTYWGIHGMGGLSYNYAQSKSISFAVGAVVNAIETVNIPVGRYFVPVVDGAVGIFLDRNNSLLGSIIFTGPKYYNAQLNIYPGWLNSKRWTPGFFVGMGEIDGFLLGLSLMNIPVGVVGG